MAKAKGLFVTFEGGEGAGKTTQIKLLSEYIQSKYAQDVVETREPGGTPGAEKIRNLIIQKEGVDWTPLSETLMFFAARHIHVENLIKPALDTGKIILCDRFTDSTRTYQSYGHGLDPQTIETINDITLNGFEPDLTFIIDLDVVTGLKRAKSRLQNDNSGEDRYESLNVEFHERLHKGFLEIAENNPQRCRVIDGSGSIEQLSLQIQSEFDKLWAEHHNG